MRSILHARSSVRCSLANIGHPRDGWTKNRISRRDIPARNVCLVSDIRLSAITREREREEKKSRTFFRDRTLAPRSIQTHTPVTRSCHPSRFAVEETVEETLHFQLIGGDDTINNNSKQPTKVQLETARNTNGRTGPDLVARRRTSSSSRR